MRVQEARDLGDRLASLILNRQFEEAYDLLLPVLSERTPFCLLDVLGAGIGKAPQEVLDSCLDRIAAQQTMGGWVVIASALRQQLVLDLTGAFERCRKYIIAADVWYAADSFGERVPGPALVSHFEPALALLEPWREDTNPWVRRIVGVAVHYWAKRARGKASHLTQAATLLNLLKPLFEEGSTDAVKGTGWGLKTLGRYYPELVADWLVQQAGRPHRALMLRKATTYLAPELRQRIAEKML